MQTCDLTGTLLDIDGSPLAFGTLTAHLDAAIGVPGVQWTDGLSPGRRKVSVTADRNGDFTLRLARGMCVQVRFPGVEQPLPLLVPDVATARLVDYLSPYLTAMDWAEYVLQGTEWEMQDLVFTAPLITEKMAGESIGIVMRATYSNGTTAPFYVEAIEAAPGTFAALNDRGLDITAAAPGDIIVSSVESEVSVYESVSTYLLLPIETYILTTPSDLTVRFV